MPNELTILETPSVAILERLLDEATRSKAEGVPRFVEPASGTLDRAVARQHHLVFGRRGSGKSSLLRKAAADLTVDRRPIVFVDLETYKGHDYPDVLLSVLIETFERFAEWLETAAIAPANKTSFWNRLFGKKPTRKPFNKAEATASANRLRKSIQEFRDLLFSEDEVPTETKKSTKATEKEGTSDELSLGAQGVKVGFKDEVGHSIEESQEQTKKYTKSKIQHLQRHILDYQATFRAMAKLSTGDAYLVLDDLYHIRRRDQAQVIDYFHRLGKGNNLWLKIGTIRHRTQWYINGDPPVGTKIGDDIGEIDLDLTLEKYSLTRTFLGKILDNFLGEANLTRDNILTEGSLDRLVLASGGVTRDFLGILRRSILVARERGDTSRGPKIGAEDVNTASGEYDSFKREELNFDSEDSRKLEDELGRIADFVRGYAKASVFLMDKDLPASEMSSIEELVDLRLIHRVKTAVTVADRPGKKFEAFMLDLSQYTASRKKRDLEIIEFWRPDAADSIRRPGLIYKELINGQIITKQWTRTE